jgi:hypothetical protein
MNMRKIPQATGALAEMMRDAEHAPTARCCGLRDQRRARQERRSRQA